MLFTATEGDVATTVTTTSESSSSPTKGPKKATIKPDTWWLEKRNPSAKKETSPPPLPAKSPLRELFSNVPSTKDSRRFSTVKGYFKSPEDETHARRELTPPALKIIKRREALEARAKLESIGTTPPEYYSGSSPTSASGDDKDHSIRLRNRLEQVKVPDYYEDTNFVEPSIVSKPATVAVPDYYEDTNIVLPKRPPFPIVDRRKLRVPRKAAHQRKPNIDIDLTTLPRLSLSAANTQHLVAAQSFSDLPVPPDPKEAQDLETAWEIKQRKISLNCLEDLPPEHGLTELFSALRIPPETR